MDERNFLDEIGPEIRELVSGYIRAESFTHSPGEKDAERFFLDYFRGQPSVSYTHLTLPTNSRV